MEFEPIQVQESKGVVIKNASLRLTDMDTPDNQLVFVITKKPSYGKISGPIRMQCVRGTSRRCAGVILAFPYQQHPVPLVNSLKRADPGSELPKTTN